jgi:hypothetical protein
MIGNLNWDGTPGAKKKRKRADNKWRCLIIFALEANALGSHKIGCYEIFHTNRFKGYIKIS